MRLWRLLEHLRAMLRAFRKLLAMELQVICDSIQTWRLHLLRSWFPACQTICLFQCSVFSPVVAMLVRFLGLRVLDTHVRGPRRRLIESTICFYCLILLWLLPLGHGFQSRSTPRPKGSFRHKTMPILALCCFLEIQLGLPACTQAVLRLCKLRAERACRLLA